MANPVDLVRRLLQAGPLTAMQLVEKTGLSQPSVSRAVKALGAAVVRLRRGKAIHYLLRDGTRGLADTRVYRVGVDGVLMELGVLLPVMPDGYLMQEHSGRELYSEGLPWWLLDMRPQGYLGRAWAARHGAGLFLPARISEWSDSQALRALLAHGHDVVGNLLLGDLAREQFLTSGLPPPIAAVDKARQYPQLAHAAAQGELPGSLAGGEQPKFTAWVEHDGSARHVLVKFSEPDGGAVAQRWQDILLAEHWALQVLRDGEWPAACTTVLEGPGQRFLEVERFDRVGDTGRRGLVSLAALDAEFVGYGSGPWPLVVAQLVEQGQVEARALEGAALLWAFGTLIGNSDMHYGNLSFLVDSGRPYVLAPAYDMSPMAFAPRSGGGLPDRLPEPSLPACVAPAIWRAALELARQYQQRLAAETRFSARFEPCLAALASHIELAAGRIARLG